MEYARAVIAAVLATSLALIVVIQEVTTRDDTVTEDGIVIDGTFAIIALVIVVLVVPDAVVYLRKRQDGKKRDEPVNKDYEDD